MKHILLYALLLVGLTIGVKAQDIILLHTNDLHSKINGYSPALEYTPLSINDDKTHGGFARIAGLVDNIKKDHPNDIVLTVDAGDFLMGSLFHPLESETGFQLQLMKKMGYDYMTLGNHEFDFGPDGLAGIIEHSMKNDIPSLILSNIEFNDEDAKDDRLKALFDKGIIKPYRIHEEKGVKIGFLGIIGYDAEDVQPYVKPAKFTDPIKAVKKLSNHLIKNEGVDMVIVLSHSGVIYKKGKWTGEDVKLAKKTGSNLMAIISGHTHTTLTEPIITKGVPIVQTGSGGKNLGMLTLTKDENEYKFNNHKLIPIDDKIMGVESIQEEIESQKEMVQHKILDQFDIKYNDALFETSFDLQCKEDGDLAASTLGPLLADAIYHYVESTGLNTDISIVAAGVIRDQMRTGNYGKQNIADVFRISSLGEGRNGVPGYAIAQAYITGKELKGVLEVLYLAQKSTTAAYCYVSGAKVEMNAKGGFLNKVKKIEIRNENNEWVNVSFKRKDTTLYAISANEYMLELINFIKEKSFGLVKVIPKNPEGVPYKTVQEQYVDFNSAEEGVQEGKEWMALYYYMLQFPDTNGNGIPDMPVERKNTLNPVSFIKK